MPPNRCLFVEVLTIKRAEVNFNFLLHQLLKVNRKPFCHGCTISEDIVRNFCRRILEFSFGHGKEHGHVSF